MGTLAELFKRGVTQIVALGGTTTRSGEAAGLVVAEIQQSAGILETRTFTIGADVDCFTDKTAPIAAELITGIFDGTKKRCRLTYHVDQGVPFASVVVATLNAGDDNTALARLTYVDVTAGGTGTIDTRQRTVSRSMPVIEWDLTQTDSYVDRIDLGGWLDAGTGAGVVYITVETW